MEYEYWYAYEGDQFDPEKWYLMDTTGWEYRDLQDLLDGHLVKGIVDMGNDPNKDLSIGESVMVGANIYDVSEGVSGYYMKVRIS